MTVDTQRSADRPIGRACQQGSSGREHNRASKASAAAEPVALTGVTLTNVSWSAPDAMSRELWIQSGRRLGAIGRGVGWWIGDWLRFGNERYGEKYAKASRITGYDPQTLMNMVYVASNVDPSRRREKLSWSHHAEVAALAADEQDRWLDLAEGSRLSVHDLRLTLRSPHTQAGAAKIDEPPTPDSAVCPACGHSLESTVDPQAG